MLPDLRTIVLILAITTIVSAIALFLFYRLLKEVQGLKYAAMGAGFQAVASLFLVSRASIDHTLSIMVSNIGYFLSILFYYQASRLLADLKPAWLMPSAVLALLSASFLFYLDNQYLAERIIIASSGMTLLAFMTSYSLWTNAKQLPGRLGVSVSFFLIGLISLWRIISMFSHPIRDMNFLDFNQGYMIFLLAIISNIVTSVGFIVLTSEKLQHQLRKQMTGLSQARDIAQQSLQEQQHFLSMLSHEFKAPIAAIQANADAVLMLQKEKAPTVEESLQRIKNVSVRLTTLVEQTLDDEWMAHAIEHNQADREPVSLTQILKEATDEFDVHFESTLTTEARLMGEALFLPVLFSNLIANACKHAQQIQAVSVTLLDDNNDYIIHVSDDGIGIPEQHHQYLFDKYYRVDHNKADGGSGLGLYFAKRICDRHHGYISVKCDTHTVFTVRLPKAEVLDA
nr:HAMP domain-containing sensor histidine kinase [uncultured Methylophaga sp.]